MPLPRSFHSILDDCIAAIRRGETVDACLSRYPRHADRLRPLLQLADKVRKTPIAPPRPWPQATAWNRVRQRAADLRSPRRGVRVRVSYGAWLRPVAVTMAVLIALVSATGGTALAAQNSLPDSPLYRVKLATEEVRLLVVFDDVNKAEILIEQSDERMEEILTLARQDKMIPGNVLSALRSRNERAADILTENPEEVDLLSTLIQQSEGQEGNLILLEPTISESAYTDYTEAVAAVHNARLPGAEGLVGVQPEELAAGVLHISGAAQPIGQSLWSVGGIEVRVDKTTIGESELQPGATANFTVGKNSRGQYRALTLTTIQTDLPAGGSVVSGEVEQITDEGIVIAGQLIPITADTLRTGRIKAGQKVEIKLGKSQSGGLAASTVRGLPATGDTQGSSAELWFEGVIEGDVKKSNEWKIGGLEFIITANTDLDARAGEAKNGARALVVASMQEGQLLADSVTVLASDAASESAYVVGTFVDSEEGVWHVSGLELVPPVRTEEPEPGSLFAMDLRRHGNDLEVQSATLIAEPGDTGIVRLNGVIAQIEGALWTMDFGTVRVASTADVSGPEAIVGARALIWGRQNQNGAFEASYSRVLDKSSVVTTSTPAPEPTQ